MLLSELKVGEEGIIERVADNCSDKVRRRLLDLGFTSGQRVRLAKKSILGKVVLVEIRGYSLSLLKKIASFVIVGGKNGRRS